MRVTDHYVSQDIDGGFFVAYVEVRDVDHKRHVYGSKHYQINSDAFDALRRMVSDARSNKFQPFTY